MAQGETELTDWLRELADSPRHDNAAYLAAMAQARKAFSDAEKALGGPVRVKMKAKIKRGDSYVVKWTFKRAK